MPRYLSGRARRTSQANLSADRYSYLSLEQAEPNLGDPKIGDTEAALPVGQQYQVISVIGYPGKRYWIPRGGGLIPGSISVYNEGLLTPPGGFSSITQLNFVGAAVSAQGYLNPDGSPGIAATITVFSPGNNTEVLFNNSNEFSTSPNFTFDYITNRLSIGGGLNVGIGGTILTTNTSGFVGVRTENPTQELDVNGDIRLRGTIYDWENNPGNPNQLLVKNNFGGLIWIDQQTIKAGAGGTYQNVQFHNSAGLIDGAPNFVYDEINSRVGIGSTRPTVTLDVRGISKFTGPTEINFLNVTGVTTTAVLAVSGATTTRNLQVSGITTLNHLDGTNAKYTGIVTATKFVGDLDTTNLNVTGIATIATLKVTGLTTSRNLQVFNSSLLSTLKVSGISTFDSQVNINNLGVTGVSTLGNVKISSNNVTTSSGQLNIDSADGITRVNDILYVTDLTDSTSTDSGAIIVDGGVGIDKSLYVGGETHLATLGGITTAGGDMYVKGNLYVGNDITFDELFAQRGKFFASLETNNFYVSGVSTFIGIATFTSIGIGTNNPRHSLHVQGTSKFTGISTFDSFIDANGGAYIDNIQIGISSDNTINTSSGPLILDSAANSTIIDDQLSVTGIATFNNYIDANGGAYIDNIQIGISNDNKIDTSTGNLTVSSNGGTVIVDSILSVTGNASFDSNVTLGNGTPDNITFNGRVNSSIIPNGTVDIGSAASRWNVIYATTFNGEFKGIADKADTIKTISTATNAPFYPTFVDSNNTTIDYEHVYTDAGISYNPNTNTLSLTNLLVSDTSTFNGNVTLGNENTDTVTFNSRVNSSILPITDNLYNLGSSSNKWNSIYATSFNGQFLGNADTATKLQTPRNIAITGDLAWDVTFDGSTNVSSAATLATVNSNVGTFGDTVTIPQITVNNKGLITGVTSIPVNFSSATVLNSDNLKTISTASDALFYPTFVNSNNSVANYEAIFTDAGITYNPASNLLSLTNSITSGISSFYGNVILGDTITDTVTFNSRVNSSVLPSTNGTLDLGGASNKWNNIYANTFTGTFSGIAEKADTIRTISTATSSSFYLTFVDSNNSVGQHEALYTDDGISYNPNTNILSTSNLTVAGISSFYGNVILGDTITDTVTFNSRVNSSIVPSTVGTLDLGDATNKWNNVYATTFNGTFVGVAEKTDTLKTISASNNNAQFYLTFVDSNNLTADYESVFTDTNLSYNPSSDTLFLTNISVTGICTINGNITLGNESTIDTVTFNSRVNSSIVPSTVGTLDLGDATNKWNNVYANNFTGRFIGSSDSTEKLKTISTATNAQFYLTFVDSNNLTADYESVFTDFNLLYNPSSDTLFLTNIYVTGICTINGSVTLGDTISDNISVNGRFDKSIVPSTNETIDLGTTTNKWNNVYANTFTGTFVGVADKVDLVRTISTDTNLDYYLTFVKTTSVSGSYETLWNDSNFKFNPSTNTIIVPNIKPSSIVDSTNNSGGFNYVLTSDGGGGWKWQAPGGGGNGSVISGITVKEEGEITPPGGVGIVTTLNFVGAGVTASGDASGTVTIYFPDVQMFALQAITAANQAASSAAAANASAQQAAASSSSAIAAAQQATSAATTAQQAATSAQQAATSAQQAATSANTSAQQASSSASGANTSAQQATSAATTAQQAAQQATSASTAAQQAAQQATSASTTAQQAAQQAAASATSANSSAQQAAGSASASNTSAQQSAASAQQASSSATSANASAQQSAASAAAANTSAQQAALSAQQAAQAANATNINAGSANQVIYKNASNQLTGSPNLTFNGIDLSVGGDVIAFTASDKRLKKEIRKIKEPLEKIDKISGNEFIWNEKSIYNNEKDIGVIAQEIQEVLPEIVITRDNGYLAVRYEKIIPLLIESIKELKKEVFDLKKKIK